LPLTRPLRGAVAGVSLAAICLAGAGCGAGLSDLDWQRVASYQFHPDPGEREQGESVCSTGIVPVPSGGTYIAGHEVSPGLSDFRAGLRACDDYVEEGRTYFNVRFCAAGEPGPKEIRLKLITGANEQVEAVGSFFIRGAEDSASAPCGRSF